MNPRYRRDPEPRAEQVRNLRRNWGLSLQRAKLIAELHFGIVRP